MPLTNIKMSVSVYILEIQKHQLWFTLILHLDIERFAIPSIDPLDFHQSLINFPPMTKKLEDAFSITKRLKGRP